jgi:hypothetical protein
MQPIPTTNLLSAFPGFRRAVGPLAACLAAGAFRSMSAASRAIATVSRSIARRSGARRSIAALAAAAVPALISVAMPIVAASPASAKSPVLSSPVLPHKDERLGFTINTPKDWTAVATAVDERWIVAKYMADKSSFWTDKATGYTAEHKAGMQIIAFVSEAVKAKVKVTEKEDAGKKETTIEFLNPYKDYKDFLTKRYTGGGWFIEKETQDKVGDVPVTIYDIRVEKSSNEGPKRISTWIYHVQDMDLAVQFECLESALPKIQAEIQTCFKSFKTIKRNGEAIAEASTGGDTVIRVTNSEVAKMTPEDRKKQRTIEEKRAHEQATKSAPEGWTVKRMGRFLVVSHADEKFTKRIVEHCEAVWKWLDSTLSFVGEKEYVRVPILRVCKGPAEFNAYFKESGADWTNIELVTADSGEGNLGRPMEIISRQMFRHWLIDKDPELRYGFPYWLGIGMGNLMGNATVKADKLEFKADGYIRDELRQAARDKKLVPAKQLMTTEDDNFWNDNVNWSQGGALVEFLVVGPASKDRKTKDLFVNYVKNLQAVLSEIAAEEEKQMEKGDKKAKTEEEEDAQVKARGQAYKDRLKRVVDQTLERTFKGWTSDDWKKFEDAYMKAID